MRALPGSLSFLLLLACGDPWVAPDWVGDLEPGPRAGARELRVCEVAAGESVSIRNARLEKVGSLSLTVDRPASHYCWSGEIAERDGEQVAVIRGVVRDPQAADGSHPGGVARAQIQVLDLAPLRRMAKRQGLAVGSPIALDLGGARVGYTLE